MDLMTLAAKITLDDSSYTKGIKNAESMGQQLAGKMSAMTVAVGNLAADVIRKTVSAMSGVVSGAVDSFANYQQLIGGVETLFKASADKVKKYAEQSYKATGLSANAYMETVTSFSASLLQGLGGDTEQAAEMANLAIQDMADNANKMGTDISSIQAAYQGFAKQNYTMLDNLKLGYGGTASEMVRLINDSGILEDEIKDLDGITFDQLVQAIHVVQTEIGITGTTAEEAASTLEGSKNAMKAAWEDLLTAIASPKEKDHLDGINDPMSDALEKWKESFAQYAENLVPTLIETIKNSGDLAQAVGEVIGDLPSDLLPTFVDAGLEAAAEAISGLDEIVGVIIDGIVNTFRELSADPSKVWDLGNEIGIFIGNAIGDLLANMDTILGGIITIGVSLAGGLIQGLKNGLFGEGNEVDKITDQLQEDLTDIEVDSTKAQGILKYMQDLNKEYGEGATKTAEWKAAQEELEKYLPGAGKVFEDYGNNVQGAINRLETLNEAMRRQSIVSGLESAMSEMETLYGEQLGRQTIAETSARIGESQKSVAQDKLNQTALAYADAIMKIYDDRKADQLLMGERTGQVISNARHTLNTGESDKIDELIEALENYYEKNDIEDRGTIWGKDSEDEILSPEQIKEYDELMSQLDVEIKQATEEAAAAQEEAEATWDKIQITQLALDDALKHQFDAYDSASNDVTEGGSQVEDALSGVALKIAAIKIPTHIATVGYDYMPEDTGIDYVPYSGFRASLHRGEAILTASENAQRRSGGGSAEVVDAIQGLRNDIQNIKLVVGQKAFGSAVVDYGGNGMRNYIGNSESSLDAGYGT